MKVTTKKAIQLGLNAVILASALQVNAAGTIPPSTTADPTASTISNGSCAMVGPNSAFSFTPSKNVGLAYNCDTVTVVVQSGNTKGKYVYGGSSNGGSVKQCGSTSVSTTNGYASGTLTLSATADGCS